MAKSFRKGVGPAATLIADLTTTPGGQSVLIHNNSAGTIYIGGSDVTQSDSFALATNTFLSFVIDGSEAVYGVTATTTLTVQVFRTNVSQSIIHG